MELRKKFNLVVNNEKVLRIMQDFDLKFKIRFNLSEPNTIFYGCNLFNS